MTVRGGDMVDDEPTDLFSAYLAGPGVFLPDPVGHGEMLKAACRTHRVRGVYPIDATLDLSAMAKREAGAGIKAANVGLIRGVDVVIADVTPFRGPSADVGTAWEMGFAEGLGLPVFAYSSEPRPYSHRVPHQAGRLGVDGQGMSVEDFDLADNLMLVADVEVSATVDEAVAAAVRWWRAAHPEGAE